MKREDLFARFGRPEYLGQREPNVLVFLHKSEESAYAYLNANNEHYGYPGWAEETEAGWTSVVDVSGAVTAVSEHYE